MAETRVRMRLNGEPVEAEAPAGTFLLEFLRRRGLTGAKEGCGVGVCGACTVLVDGSPVSACLYWLAAADGAEVWTVEGIAHKAPDLVAAFAEHEGMQCGICTPGQVVSAFALLARHPRPDEATIANYLSGNLCRCTGYASIRRAVLAASGQPVPEPVAAEGGAGDGGL